MVAIDQLEFNGLVMGPGTDYVVKTILGLNPPDYRVSSQERASDHGSYAFAQYSQERMVELVGLIHGSDPREKINQLRQAWAPQPGINPMTFRLGSDFEKRIYCLPNRLHWDTTAGFKKGYVEWAGQLRAGDPRIYSEEEFSLVIPRGSSGVAINQGTVGAWPLVRLTGPLTNPSLVNTSSGKLVKLNTTIGSGVEVELDFAEGTVKQGGVSNYGGLDTASDWWYIESGGNTIDLLGDAGSGTASIFWRSSWL